MLGQASLSGLFLLCLYLQSEFHMLVSKFTCSSVHLSVKLSVFLSACVSVNELSVVLLHLAGVAVETEIHFPLRLEVNHQNLYWSKGMPRSVSHSADI